MQKVESLIMNRNFNLSNCWAS